MRHVTKEIAYAAMFDAGNRSARAAGRKAWSEDDRDAAAAEFNRLAALIPGDPFFIAYQREQGLL